MFKYLTSTVIFVLMAFLPLKARGEDSGDLKKWLQEATELYRAGDVEGADFLYDKMANRYPDNANIHKILGTIFLGQLRLDKAEAMFDRARRIDDSADSWYGYGMAAAGGGEDQKKKAIKRFKKALERDRKFVDAKYQLAIVERTLGKASAKLHMEEVLRIDRNYTAAYVALSRWTEHEPYGLEEAAEWCEKGLKLLPDDPGLQIRWAELQLLTEDGEGDEVLENLMAMLKERPKEIRSLPIIAQVHLKKRRIGAAEATFRAFLNWTDPQERAYYEDISIVGTPKEIRVYNTLTPEQLGSFLKQFWARRDVDLTGDVNLRRLEHYRRVWVARTRFSVGRTPWDRRGEIYIRYGEPNFRQRNGEPDYEKAMDPDVRKIRDRIATKIYGPGIHAGDQKGLHAILMALAGRQTHQIDPSIRLGLGNPVTNIGQDSLDAGHSDNLEAGSLLPMDIGLVKGPAWPLQAAGSGYTIVAAGGTTSVPWESWIYRDIEGGVEFVFTDEYSRGIYEFAPIPSIWVPQGIKVGGANVGRTLQNMRLYAPEQVFYEVKAAAPTRYMADTPSGLLTFHASAVDFRGQGDSSRVEVFLGVPVSEIAPTEQGWLGKRTVAVYDKSWRTVHRSVDRSALPVPIGYEDEILDKMTIDLPPGDFYVALKITDRTSKRTQVFRDTLQMGSYGEDSLKVSGIELAQDISSSAVEGKFVKNGLRVIPKPSRIYRQNQSVYVYFEIYNLNLNEQGKSHFRVDYAVKKLKGGVGNFVLAGLGRFIGRSTKGNEVTVSYDQGGDSPDDFMHTALEGFGGKGDYIIKVTVTDLNNGVVKNRRTTFSVR